MQGLQVAILNNQHIFEKMEHPLELYEQFEKDTKAYYDYKIN